jgi:hypothetical protein
MLVLLCSDGGDMGCLLEVTMCRWCHICIVMWSSYACILDVMPVVEALGGWVLQEALPAPLYANCSFSYYPVSR